MADGHLRLNWYLRRRGGCRWTLWYCVDASPASSELVAEGHTKYSAQEMEDMAGHMAEALDPERRPAEKSLDSQLQAARAEQADLIQILCELRARM